MNLTADGTFVVDVPNGTYSVTVSLGDLGSTARDQMAVYLEGTQVDTVTTAARSVATETYQVTVADGQLTLRLQDQGGKNKTAAIAAFTLAMIDAPAPAPAPAPAAAPVRLRRSRRRRARPRC